MELTSAEPAEDCSVLVTEGDELWDPIRSDLTSVVCISLSRPRISAADAMAS